MSSALRPPYRALPEIAPGHRHAWDVTADGDARTGPRRATADAVVAASRLVRRGVTFNVDLELGRFPSEFLGRGGMRHHVELTSYGRDDRLDHFYLQSGTQWDALRHIRYRRLGYFGGLTDAELDASSALGIGGAAEHGIVGRAVLLDIERHWREEGRISSPASRTRITVDDLVATLAREHLTARDGDVLLVRTGWLRWLWREAGAEYASQRRVETAECVGLDASERMAEWIWDSGAVAVACDTPSLEAMPVRAKEEGFLHQRLVALLGILIGELWDLEALADDCAADGVYEGLLVSSPLNIARAAGSPANAYVIK